jgi:hypothetical protein
MRHVRLQIAGWVFFLLAVGGSLFLVGPQGNSFPMVPLAIQFAGFAILGVTSRRGDAWLVAGLMFLPALAADALGAERDSSYEGPPFPLIELFFSPVFLVGYWLGRIWTAPRE